MSEDKQDDILRSLEDLLETLGGIEARHSRLTADADRQIAKIRAKFSGPIDELTKQREEIVGSIAYIYAQYRDQLTDGSGKTVTLRGGTLSARLAPESLVLGNDSDVERYLRRKGAWLKFTKRVKRQIDKTALKKDHAFVDQAPDEIMHLRQEENLIIKLPKLQLEIKRVLNPLKKRLSGDA